MKWGKVLGVGVAMAFTLVQSGWSSGRDLMAIRLANFETTEGTALLDLCKHACIPCGFENTAPLTSSDPARPLRFRDWPIRGIVGYLISTSLRNYSARTRGEMLEVTPKDVVMRRSASSLDQIVPAISIDSAPVSTAIEQLCLSQGVAQPSTSTQVGNPIFGVVSVHLAEVTVREALSTLVRKDGKSTWMIQQAPDGSSMIQVMSCREDSPDSDDSTPSP
jgi:hypothetical protein